MTKNGHIYSWGFGRKGALGFGDKQDILTPTLLNIIDENNLKQEAKQIACGNNYSLCLTIRNVVYSWGSGEFGKLGHGSL